MSSNSREFYRAEIDGMLFKAVLSSDGPYILGQQKGGHEGGGVAMGHCASIQFLDPSGNPFDPAKGGWWIVKYNKEPRISLELLTKQGRRELSQRFGIPLQESPNRMTGRQSLELFLASGAFEGLCEWTRKHPRIARRYQDCRDYMPWFRWVEEAQQKCVPICRTGWVPRTL